MLFLFSALVVLLLTGAAWAFGFRAQPVLDRQSAIAEAEGRLAGFRTAQVALADCGRGAVLQGADGRLAVLIPFGDGWLARLLPPGARLAHNEGRIVAGLAEPMLRAPSLALAAPPRWLLAHLP